MYRILPPGQLSFENFYLPFGGRPIKDPAVQDKLKQQARQDEKVRVWIEGRFGQAKRRFSLARVMAKLADTAQSAIAITFLVLNLERWLRQLFILLFWLYALGRQTLHRWIEPYEASNPSIEELTAFGSTTMDSSPEMSELAIALPFSA